MHNRIRLQPLIIFILQKKMEKFDDKFMMRVFCKPDKAHDMTALLEEITVKETNKTFNPQWALYFVCSDHLVNLYGPTVLMDPEMTKAADELMQQGALMSPIMEEDQVSPISMPLALL